jgi:hypothetical protein
MIKSRQLHWIAGLLLACLLLGLSLIPVVALADGYLLGWGGVSSGGGEAGGGGYTMTSVLAVADLSTASGGVYTVTGGGVLAPYQYQINVPNIRR